MNKTTLGVIGAILISGGLLAAISYAVREQFFLVIISGLIIIIGIIMIAQVIFD